MKHTHIIFRLLILLISAFFAVSEKVPENRFPLADLNNIDGKQLILDKHSSNNL